MRDAPPRPRRPHSRRPAIPASMEMAGRAASIEDRHSPRCGREVQSPIQMRAQAHLPPVLDAAAAAAIVRLCKEHGVRRLGVFGSAVKATFDPKTSDLDFVVEFNYSTRMRPSDQYFGLKDGLEKLLGRPVDLVCYRAIRNPYFLRAVDESQVELYAA